MVRKTLQFIGKHKCYACAASNINDLAEVLHYPWHTNELFLVLAFVLWCVWIRLAIIVFVEFGKRAKYVFNVRNCRFFLWLLYFALSAIAISNLACCFNNEAVLFKFYCKTIVTIVALAIDFKETTETIRRCEELQRTNE